MLTYYYPPGNTPAARRMTHLIKAFAETEPVYVITATLTATQFEHVKETVMVNSPDLRSMLGALRPAPARVQDKTIGVETKSRTWVKPLLLLRQAYPFLYLTDDGGPLYRKEAFKAACGLIEKHGVTRVFSSFRPWSDHLIAARLKKKYPGLRWIADFRDLPVDPVRKDVWWPALQTWWGKRVIKSADEVWVVSEGQREQLASWHPNIKVVRNALLRLPPEQTAPLTERFTIVYTGSFYDGLQSVDPLVESLLDLLAEGTISPHKLSLVYRGKDAELFRRQAARLPVESLDIQPSIAPAAAQKMQRTAQVLLLLNWSAQNYYGVLTAKLWDYLAAGRPIVALVNGPGDEELKDIIEGAAAGAVFADNEQGELATYLTEQYGKWLKTKVLEHVPNLAKLKDYL
jgi:hypothetical protein